MQKQNKGKIMKVKAHLKTPNSPTSQIIFTLSDSGKVHIKHHLGIVIPSKHWSKKQEKVLPSNPNAVAYNMFIEERKKQVIEIYLSFKAKGQIPTGKQIAQIVRNKLKKINANAEFWEIYELFLHQKKAKTSEAYEMKYLALQKHLQDFEAYSKQKFELDKISKATFERLETYLIDIKKINLQTTAKYLGFFKGFLNWCIENKHTQNTDFRFFKITQQPDTLKVALTENEIQLLRNVDLSGKPYLENVRKLFLLSCFVGLRYSDYSRISLEHLKQDANGNYNLEIRQKKTKDFVSVPLTPESLSLVRQLLSRQIRPISNQKMNEYVKELCRLAGIDEPFEVTIFKGKHSFTYSVPKWKLISSHTARRTFATNLLLKGVPAEIVMQFTGHKDYKSFTKYVNVPKQTALDIVRKAMLGVS